MTKRYPALVSLKLGKPFSSLLEGLSLKNIRVRLIADEWREEECGGTKAKKKKRRAGAVLFEDFGELVFTGTGISGPVVLSASSYAAPLFDECSM